MKIFVSLPMQGCDIDEIRTRQADIFLKFANTHEDECELMNTTHEALCPPDDNFLWYLGLSIQQLGEADLVIFSKDWRDARGCRVEHAICEYYKIPYVYEDGERHVDE